MSKAFTSEETPDLGPLARPPPRLAPGEIRYATPEGMAELRAELSRLGAERDGLRGTTDPAEAARAAELARRAELVERTLATLTPLGADAAPEGTVAFATWVTVEDEEGARRTWRLVGPDEADPRRGLLNALSPLAGALLGLRVGEVAEVERPGGPVELTVVAVSRTRPGP